VYETIKTLDDLTEREGDGRPENIRDPYEPMSDTTIVIVAAAEI